MKVCATYFLIGLRLLVQQDCRIAVVIFVLPQFLLFDSAGSSKCHYQRGGITPRFLLCWIARQLQVSAGLQLTCHAFHPATPLSPTRLILVPRTFVFRRSLHGTAPPMKLTEPTWHDAATCDVTRTRDSGSCRYSKELTCLIKHAPGVMNFIESLQAPLSQHGNVGF